MAGQRLTDKASITQQVGSGDLLMVVDVSDTTGSAQGTSKQMDFKYLLQTDKISISNAELQALDSSPKTLVGALSGYMITVSNIAVLCTYASSTESAAKSMYFGYDSSVTSNYWTRFRQIMNGSTDDLVFCSGPLPPSGGTDTSSIINKPFIVWADGAFNGGWTADVYVTYCYTKII